MAVRCQKPGREAVLWGAAGDAGSVLVLAGYTGVTTL